MGDLNLFHNRRLDRTKWVWDKLIPSKFPQLQLKLITSCTSKEKNTTKLQKKKKNFGGSKANHRFYLFFFQQHHKNALENQVSPRETQKASQEDTGSHFTFSYYINLLEINTHRYFYMILTAHTIYYPVMGWRMALNGSLKLPTTLTQYLT